MTTRNGSPLTWTVDNLPASLGASQGSSTFSYGPDRARYQQTATYNGSTATTTYIGGLFEVVATATTTEYRHNIVADGEVIAVHTIDQSGNATTSYLHYDHLGSVDKITDDQGTIAQTMSFDAFGLRRDAANWDYDLTAAQITALKDDTDRGYTFQEQLDNVGLIHLNGRVYDPSIGRFISGDPIEGGNRYAYVEDSPLDYTDPSGFVCGGNNGTETCTEMDGGGAGYQSGGGTGDAGADSPSGGGGGYDTGLNLNTNSLPPCAGDQITGCTAQLGKIVVTAPWIILNIPYFTWFPINPWSNLIFSYTNPSASQNGGPQGSGGGPNRGKNPQQKPSKACLAGAPTSAQQLGIDQVQYADTFGNSEISTGSRDYATNNPQALTGYSSAEIASYTSTVNGAPVTSPIFATPGIGQAAALPALNNALDSNSTLLGAMQTYTGANPPLTANSWYVTTNLAPIIGATASTSPMTLSASQVQQFQAGQQAAENWHGTTTCGGG